MIYVCQSPLWWIKSVKKQTLNTKRVLVNERLRTEGRALPAACMIDVIDTDQISSKWSTLIYSADSLPSTTEASYRKLPLHLFSPCIKKNTIRQKCCVICRRNLWEMGEMIGFKNTVNMHQYCMKASAVCKHRRRDLILKQTRH